MHEPEIPPRSERDPAPDPACRPEPSRPPTVVRRIRGAWLALRWRLDELSVAILSAAGAVVGVEALFVLLDLWPVMPVAIPLTVLAYATVYAVRRWGRRCRSEDDEAGQG